MALYVDPKTLANIIKFERACPFVTGTGHVLYLLIDYLSGLIQLITIGQSLWTLDFYTICSFRDRYYQDLI